MLSVRFRDYKPPPTVSPTMDRPIHHKGSEEIYIGVIGATGAGKSSFIQLATGQNVPIGHTLLRCECSGPLNLHFLDFQSTDSCKGTQNINAYLFDHRNFRIILLDTPGFDDTLLSDAEVLSGLVEYLGISYNNNIRLSGIIYLHCICWPRGLGGSTINHRFFEKLGKNFFGFGNVFLVTTMWDRVDRREGDKREAQLKSDDWGFMYDRGSQILRHYNTKDSALAIIDTVLEAWIRTAAGTNLLRAAQDGDVDGLEKCVREGVDVAATNEILGRTALHFAAQAGHVEAVKYLIKKGADTTAIDVRGRQARDLAVSYEVNEVFDNPPPVTRAPLLALKKFQKLQKPPISPLEGKEKEVTCEYDALLYYYESTTQTTQDVRMSIHDLIYPDKHTEAKSQEEENLDKKMANRWIHLTANNVSFQTQRAVLANKDQ